MGIVFRQSVKTGMVTLLGAAMGAVLVAARMELLPKQDFGILSTFISAGTILQLVIAMGAITMMQTYIQRYATDDAKHHSLLGITMLVPASAIIIFMAIYIPAKEAIINSYDVVDDRPLVRLYYYWLPALAMMWSYCTLLEAYLSTQYKTAQAAFMREVVLRVGFVVITVLLYFKVISIPAYIIGTFLCFLLELGGLLIAASRCAGFRPKLAFQNFTRVEYKDMASFSWYHLLAGSSWFVIGYFDMILLSRNSKNGFADAAIYGVAVFFISIFMMPYRTMVAAAFPRLNEAYIARDFSTLRSLYNRTALNILIVTIAMAIPIVLCLGDYISLFHREYGALLPVTLILLLGRLTEAGTGPNAEVIGVSTYYKFVFRSSLMVVVLLLVLDYYLIPAYGVLGAAWGATISWSCFNILKFIYARQKLGLQPLNLATLKVLVCGASAIAALFFIPVLLHPILDAILRTGIGLVVYGGLILWLKPSPDLQVYIDSVLKQRRLF